MSDRPPAEPPVRYIGCCGAYCGTCRALSDRVCKGCKLGYATGERDLANSRCAMKLCCLTRGLETCAECGDYPTCEILGAFHGKNGYKYRKYRQSSEFIRAYGHDAFLEQAAQWKGAYGRLSRPEP
jgi:hypothetical protein